MADKLQRSPQRGPFGISSSPLGSADKPMKYKILFLLFFISISQVYAQYEPEETYPVVGWDTFMSMISYPEIAKRASIQGNVDVAVEFDTTGNVSEIKIVGYEVFHAPIKEAINNVKWTQKFKTINKRLETAYFTVEFKLKQYDRPLRRILRIEKEKPSVKIDY